MCFKLCYNEGKDNAKEVKEWDVLEKIWILIREMSGGKKQLGNRLDVPRISRNGLTPGGALVAYKGENETSCTDGRWL